MIKLVDPEPEQALQAMWDKAKADGKAARAAGQRVDQCPPFINPDLEASWKMGWRWENERRKRDP